MISTPPQLKSAADLAFWRNRRRAPQGFMIRAGFTDRPTKEVDVPEPAPAWPSIPVDPEPVEVPELVPA